MINEIIAEKLAMLPNSPGVYIMKDAEESGQSSVILLFHVQLKVK